MDSALVFGVLDPVKPILGKPRVLPHPNSSFWATGEELFS
jgi:hypothetical protein